MKYFDANLSAKTTVKERIVWMLYLGILFFLLYGASNQYSSLNAPHPSIYFEWEKKIPFVEPFIMPYMASDIMFILAFLLPYTRLEIRVLALRVFAIVTFSVLIFILFPLQYGFSKPQAQSFTWLFDALKADLPFNQAPSLHVSFAIILWYSMQKKIKSIYLKAVLGLWFALIAISTLFVYQHHFIDLPTGALVGLLAIYFISEKKESKFLRAFTTPRSLKMALYYLLASIVFIFLAFNYWAPFVYIFLSLFFVSVVYAFGVHKVVSKYWISHLILSPYYIGNYLSYRYYIRKLPLMLNVKDRVYFGRFPLQKEHKELKEKGINRVLNLAWEQVRVYKPNFNYKEILLLDQTIPDPKDLHEAVLFIEKYKSEGIFIHCALGLSRSVLVISAWLLYNGYSRSEIDKIILKNRPNSINSAYMKIAIDIYEREFINAV